MNIKILDLERQYKKIGNEIEESVLRILKSGNYIMGTEVTKFEKEFAEFIGVKNAIAVNSGTDALYIALKALNIKPGDEVITTPFTFFATAEVIAAIGAIPVFVDINPNTLNIDVDKIEDAITDKTKVILPVHIFGNPCEIEEICGIAKKHKIKVIEDACQAVGASVGKKKVGSFGDLGAFSFFPTKNLGAFGDAGMIVTNNDDLAVIARAYRQHGMSRDGAKARFLLNNESEEYKEQIEYNNVLYNPYKYYNYVIGQNSRMDEIQATILNVKIKYLNDFNRQRKQIAEYYISNLKNIEQIQIIDIKSNYECVWHQFAIKVKEKEPLIKYLKNEGIQCASYYPIPLHLQKAFKFLEYEKGDFIQAEKCCQQTVCLPIFPELEKNELLYIVKKIKEFYIK